MSSPKNKREIWLSQTSTDSDGVGFVTLTDFYREINKFKMEIDRNPIPCWIDGEPGTLARLRYEFQYDQRVRVTFDGISLKEESPLYHIAALRFREQEGLKPGIIKIRDVYNRTLQEINILDQSAKLLLVWLDEPDNESGR